MIATKLHRRLSKVMYKGLRVQRIARRYDHLTEAILFMYEVLEPPQLLPSDISYKFAWDNSPMLINTIPKTLSIIPDKPGYIDSLYVNKWSRTLWGSTTHCHSRINLLPLDVWMNESIVLLP